MSKIRCCVCIYAERDELISGWDGIYYTCTNPDSPYHMAILNISEEGKTHSSIIWEGCKEGIELEQEKE